MKKISFVILTFFSIITTGFSQQKYGHVDSHEIQETMPEYKTMMATLEKKRNAKEYEMRAIIASIQKRQQELQEYAPGLMEAVREEKAIELDSLQQVVSGFEEKVNNDLQTLQLKLLKPLNDKYLKIVAEVAKENGYTYIFDIALEPVAYYPEKEGDITPLVKKKMGY